MSRLCLVLDEEDLRLGFDLLFRELRRRSSSLEDDEESDDGEGLRLCRLSRLPIR